MDLQAAGDNIAGGGWRRGARGVALAKALVREGWLLWGWIGVFLLVFSCSELFFYGAVARLHSGVQGKDEVGTGCGW